MREIKKRRFHNSIALIVDGENEKWYVEKVKQHYSNETLKKMAIKPELPSAKRIEELFLLAKEKVEEEFSHVFLIIDMDIPLKEESEFNDFRHYYEKYQEVKKTTNGGRKDDFKWMDKLTVIVNNPCLEFWYLLHYGKTTKFYPDFQSLKKDLIKKDRFDSYSKSESFYKNHPDIFERLGENKGLTEARKNAAPFVLEKANTYGYSEMNLIFDFFDNLKR